MTLIWFLIWLIADHVGSSEPLRFDPVNAWATTFLLAIALDLARAGTIRPSRGAADRRQGGAEG